MVQKNAKCYFMGGRDDTGRMPLHAAANCPFAAAPKIIELLAGAGANLDAVGDEGTPLKQAVRSTSKENVAALLECGADVNKRGIYGRTALHCAVVAGRGV
jgi:ankyrin repeat protein